MALFLLRLILQGPNQQLILLALLRIGLCIAVSPHPEEVDNSVPVQLDGYANCSDRGDQSLNQRTSGSRVQIMSSTKNKGKMLNRTRG